MTIDSLLFSSILFYSTLFYSSYCAELFVIIKHSCYIIHVGLIHWLIDSMIHFKRLRRLDFGNSYSWIRPFGIGCELIESRTTATATPATKQNKKEKNYDTVQNNNVSTGILIEPWSTNVLFSSRRRRRASSVLQQKQRCRKRKHCQSSKCRCRGRWLWRWRYCASMFGSKDPVLRYVMIHSFIRLFIPWALVQYSTVQYFSTSRGTRNTMQRRSADYVRIISW